MQIKDVSLTKRKSKTNDTFQEMFIDIKGLLVHRFQQRTLAQLLTNNQSEGKTVICDSKFLGCWLDSGRSGFFFSFFFNNQIFFSLFTPNGKTEFQLFADNVSFRGDLSLIGNMFLSLKMIIQNENRADSQQLDMVWAIPNVLLILFHDYFFFEPHLELVSLVNDCHLSWILISYYPFLRGSFCLIAKITRLFL